MLLAPPGVLLLAIAMLVPVAALQAQVGVVLDEVPQAVLQLGGNRQGERQLAFPDVVLPASPYPHLRDLQEAASGALLHVQ